MTRDDIDWRIGKVAALRALCLSLPHLGTPAESARLARFEQLVRVPATATIADVDALVAGWRQWWRDGRPADIAAMARAVPVDLFDHDRWLATYATAAGVDLGGRHTQMSDFDRRVELLRRTYDAFNRRDIDAVLSTLDADVEWPNMLEMTTLHGHEEVRRYWERQFEQIDPRVEPTGFAPGGDDVVVVDVHQVVRDREGRVLRDDHVTHRYAFRGALIVRMRVEAATVSPTTGYCDELPRSPQSAEKSRPASEDL